MTGVVRPTESVHGTDGRPIERDEYAQALSDQAVRLPLGDRLPLLAYGEAHAVAALLDEYAAICKPEPISRLARELALRIHDRLGT